MNRRNFLKSCLAASCVIAAGVPLITTAAKRSPKSLFTIEELRLWCKMNEFRYIEDHDLFSDGDNSNLFIHNDKKRFIRNRTFYNVSKNTPNLKDLYYEQLNYEAYWFKTHCNQTCIYDFIESNPGPHSGTFYTIRKYSSYFDNGINGGSSPGFNVKLFDIQTRSWKRANRINDKFQGFIEV